MLSSVTDAARDAYLESMQEYDLETGYFMGDTTVGIHAVRLVQKAVPPQGASPETGAPHAQHGDGAGPSQPSQAPSAGTQAAKRGRTSEAAAADATPPAPKRTCQVDTRLAEASVAAGAEAELAALVGPAPDSQRRTRSSRPDTHARLGRDGRSVLSIRPAASDDAPCAASGSASPATAGAAAAGGCGLPGSWPRMRVIQIVSNAKTAPAAAEQAACGGAAHTAEQGNGAATPSVKSESDDARTPATSTGFPARRRDGRPGRESAEVAAVLIGLRQQFEEQPSSGEDGNGAARRDGSSGRDSDYEGEGSDHVRRSGGKDGGQRGKAAHGGHNPQRATAKMRDEV